MKIVLGVTLLHLLLVFPLVYLEKIAPTLPPKQITVRTIEQKKSQTAAVEKPIAKKVEAPQKKLIAKKENTSKSTPAPANKSTDTLLTLLEESLQNLEQKRSSNIFDSKPKKIGSLKSENPPEVTYEELLTHYLQSHMRFPERGNVKVKINVKPDGKIQLLEIVSASSKTNERYVAEILPSLILPTPPAKKTNLHNLFVTLTSN